MTEEKALQIKKKLEQAKEKEVELKTELKGLEKQIKNYGFDGINEAKKALVSLEKQIENSKEELEQLEGEAEELVESIEGV